MSWQSFCLNILCSHPKTSTLWFNLRIVWTKLSFLTRWSLSMCRLCCVLLHCDPYLNCSPYGALHTFRAGKQGRLTAGIKLNWIKRGFKSASCQIQNSWLCVQGYLCQIKREAERERERFALIKAFDYSALWLCVGGEGKSRHIQRGQGGQIPQEENVETRRQKHGNSGTHPAALLAAARVNCCLETKQLSSHFFLLFFLFCLQNLQFSLWFAV